MNRLFTKDESDFVPEQFSEELNLKPATDEDSTIGTPTSVRFNRPGTILATACSTGHVILWDSLTWAMMAIIRASEAALVAMEWVVSSRILVTLDVKGTLTLTSVEGQNKIASYESNKHPRSLAVRPVRNVKDILVTIIFSDGTASQVVFLVNLSTGCTSPEDLALCPDKVLKTEPIQVNPLEKLTSAIYSPSGEILLLGSTNGHIHFVDPHSTKPLMETTNVQFDIKKLLFSKYKSFNVNKMNLLVTGQRVVHVFEYSESKTTLMPKIEPLNHAINDRDIRCVSRSPTGDFFAVGQSSTHKVQFYSIAAACEKIDIEAYSNINGGILDMDWHPFRPLIMTICNQGIQFLTKIEKENWSAFAPDFEELSENRIYEPKPSDFDFDENEKAAQNDHSVVAEIDLEENEFLLYSSQDEGDLLHIPISLEPTPAKQIEDTLRNFEVQKEEFRKTYEDFLRTDQPKRQKKA